MLVIIMAGGRGSRMGGTEKAMLEVCGAPIIEREVEGLSDHWVIVAASRWSPVTIEWCRRNGVDVVMTSGSDYSTDLGLLMRTVRKPFLVVPADMPFAGRAVRNFESAAASMDSSIVTLLVRRGSSTEPVGVSLITRDGSDWADLIMEWSPELMDVDSPEDLSRVNALCGNELIGD
ncbi:NTP transferase domain-containing protein [Thermocladium modestius]|nr:NTP transferase domain-containing protein [Thermocladium modestius]